jgi:CDP-paratose 2-epimerase
LVRAMRLAIEHPASTAEAFNLGGGVENSVSLIELIEQLQLLTRDKIEIEWGEERVADQKWYVANTSKIRDRLGWAPQVSVREGLQRLHEWYVARPLFISASEAHVA